MNRLLFLAVILLHSSSVLSNTFETNYPQNNNNPSIEQYIVILKTPSIYKQLKVKGSSINRSERSSNFQQYKLSVTAQQKQLLNSIQNEFNGKVIVNKQFVKLLNAVVVTASPSQIHLLSSMDSVKRIDKVIRHKITSTGNITDIDLIKADLVWSKEIDGVSITGKNISVGILDTGIDYNHPDLGACFGRGCRVYGGYDFANGDDDPMDDNDSSHGTHVAGIVAANGKLKGVAPDARLLAIKVCYNEGYCYNTDIINGLEFSLDPDGDIETDDGVDIINLSLGSSFHDNALVEAINNIVENGVVVVVAAGNDGPNKNVIGSPADAERSITVGASDSGTSIASFSSRGLPSSGSAILKPEVVAPGVLITSTLLDGEYGQSSGTSMASPMVAGVVALMKQYSPDITPEQIKAALIATAVPIVNELQEEGAGLVNALAAINLPVNIGTPVISFGDSEFSIDLFHVSVPFNVNNPTLEDISFDLNLGQASHPSITYQSSRSNITIPPGGSLSVDISINVDINELPISTEQPIYSSFVSFEIASQTYRIPIVLFHRSYLDIHFGTYPLNYSSLYIFNDKESKQPSYWSSDSLSGQTKRIFIAPGQYSVVDTVYNNFSSSLRESAFLFYPNVQLENTLLIEVSVDHARHKVLFDVENPFGNKISNNGGLIKGEQRGVSLTMYDKSKGKYVMAGFLPRSSNEEQVATFSFTDIPDDYTFHLFSENDSENKTENISFSAIFDSPVLQDIPIHITASDYKKITLNYAQPSWLTTPYLLPFMFEKFNLGEKTEYGAAESFAFDALGQGRVYYSTAIIDDFRFSYFSTQINNKDLFEEGGEALYLSPIFKINENNQFTLYNGYTDKAIKVFEQSNEYQLTVGKLLPFWSAGVSKQANGQYVYSFSAKPSNAFFRDSHYSVWLKDVIIRTNNSEQVVNNNYAEVDSEGYQSLNLPFESGLIETVISFDGYEIENRQSHILTQLRFDLNKEKYQPPVIGDLQINSLNELTHQLQCGKGTILINFLENISSENIKASIRKSGSSEWQQREIVKQDENIIVELSELLAGYYDLTFTATNSGGNSLSYTAEPAFHVADYIFTDQDSDCDGVDDDNDAFPLDSSETVDTDSDGIGDNADGDDDGDGVDDDNDAFPLDSSETVDTDSDGIGDNLDSDNDGDGVDDDNDAFPLDSSESVDTDSDGIGNNADDDDDGDGVNDSNDAFPLDSNKSVLPEIQSPSNSGGGGSSSGFIFLLLFMGIILRQFVPKKDAHSND